jgi:hypothetical protein
MDPISMIVGALAMGATSGLKDTATEAIRDAYEGLRDLVRRRFVGRPIAEMALSEHEKAPQVWAKPLSVELATVGADTDAQIIAAARRVMALMDGSGGSPGKYQVNLRSSQGVQVGDLNTQSNTFNMPPAK